MNGPNRPGTADEFPFSFDGDPGTNHPLLEALPDAILVVGTDGVIAALNTQAASLFGYTRTELHGELLEILLPLRLGKTHAQLRHSYAEHPMVRPMGSARDLVACRKDGSEMYVDISLSPVSTAQGMMVIATIRDASQRKFMELELRRINESLEDRVCQRTTELRTANQQLELFSYAVSHEMRSPLRIISGYGQLLLETAPDDTQKQYLETILRTADRMNGIISDLLKMGRIQHSELHLAEVDMQQLVQQATAQLQEAANAHPLQFVIGSLPGLYADSELITEVLTNLLDNALKYSRDRALSIIEISGWREGEEIYYRVRDNGAGFDMSMASKLFSPFHRLHSRREFEGTGVGLAITRNIIERHGGRIWATSQPGNGASFWFSIPIGPATDR